MLEFKHRLISILRVGFGIFCLLITLSHCRTPEFSNICDTSSKKFIESVLISNIFNNSYVPCGKNESPPRNNSAEVASGVTVAASNELWVTNDTVSAITKEGDLLYVGGSFNLIGPNTGSAAHIDLTSGEIVSKSTCPFPQSNGTINTAVSDGNGGYYIGGQFTVVQAKERQNLAHIKPDCTVDSDWNPGRIAL